MARMPRLVVPGYPHHVTHRGNRRMKTFFNCDDYRSYLGLLTPAKSVGACRFVGVLPYAEPCHRVVEAEYKDNLARLLRFVHRHYSRRINFRGNWKGHLWQERVHSFVMDERYLLATVRYTELNQVLVVVIITGLSIVAGLRVSTE